MNLTKFTDIKGAIEALKDAVAIEKIILEDVGTPPKSTGNNIFIWCPFHGEKNKPSFSISPSRKIFKCFGGCGQSGDVITWMEKFHGVSTGEAVTTLAKRVNFDLSKWQRPATEEEKKLELYQRVMNTVAEYCHTLFINNEQLKSWYLTDTGFAEDDLDLYNIGYCPSVDIVAAQVSRMYPELTQDDIRKLEIHRGDIWNNALIYPVCDESGDVCRIYSKQLNPSQDSKGKYISTTDKHPLFKQGLLYGLHLSRQRFRDDGFKARVVEGFKGAIASGAMALCGTTFTKEQVATLKRYNITEVTVCFDGDQPGYQASLRLVENMQDYQGLLIKLAQLPLDSQPDHVVKQQGRMAMEQIFERAMMPLEFVITTKFSSGVLSLQEQYALLAEVRPYLKKMSVLEAEINVRYIAGMMKVQPETLFDWVREIRIADTNMFNLEAEKSLLYHAVFMPTNWAAIKQRGFGPTHFALTIHRRLFESIEASYEEHHVRISAATIKDKVMVKFGGQAEVLALLQEIMTMEPKYKFQPSIDIVQDLWKRRVVGEQAKALGSTVLDLSQDTTQVLASHRRSMVSIVDTRHDSANTPQQIADKARRELSDRIARRGQVIGYDFSQILDVDGKVVGGMPMLNLIMSGLQNQHLVVLSAHKGVGKSLAGMNIAIPLSITQQIPGLWIAQEMTEVEQTFRMASIISGVNNTKIQNGLLNHEEELRVNKALEMIYRGKLYFHVPDKGNIDEIYAIVEDYYYRYGIKYIVWDYIQMVVAGPNERGMSREEVIGNASKVMKKRIAVDLNIPALLIAQQNRSNYVKGEITQGENIGGSYQIAQDADDLFTIAKKDENEIAENKQLNKNRGNRTLYIDKRRGGPSDLIIHAELDTDTDVSLRYLEKMEIEEQLLISKGVGRA